MGINTALVVDDSRSARYILQRLLERRNIRVELADSARQAFVCVRRNRPDVVFMDVMMPDMDGQEAIDRLGADPYTADIPIIMYTGRDYASNSAGSAHRGVIGVLSKPFSPEDVNALLAKLDTAASRERPELARLVRVQDTDVQMPARIETTSTDPLPPRMQSLDRLRMQLAEELKAEARFAVEQLLGESLETQVGAQIERHTAVWRQALEHVHNEQTHAQAQLLGDRLPRLLKGFEERLDERIGKLIEARLLQHTEGFEQRLNEPGSHNDLTPTQRIQVTHIARGEIVHVVDRTARQSARRAAAELMRTDLSALNVRLDRLRRRYNNMIVAAVVAVIAVGVVGYLLGMMRDGQF